LAIITRDLLDITEDMRDSIVHFIAYGTPTTVKRGEGERTGVLNSYKSAFSRLPGTSAEWSDVLKIANGRWPSERSGEKESAAIQIFKSVYRREANLSNPHDDAAVKIVAYGLLPSSRNLNSEKAAISIYKNIYKKAPTTAQEWNTVRAIAYSGATR